jgi:glyoxylate utilization-related uncharacterized protein
MTFTKVIVALACLMSGMLVAQEAKVTQLLSKDLTNLPGKEGLMITVEYPPGSSDPIHRHNAHGFIYVLEGSIVMQVRGGKETTLTPGQTFYEGPFEFATRRDLTYSMSALHSSRPGRSAKAICRAQELRLLPCELVGPTSQISASRH